MQLLPAVKEIIKNGDYGGRFEVSEPRKDETIAFHHFAGDVETPGGIKRVGVSVSEDAQGNKFYNLVPDPEDQLAKRNRQSSDLLGRPGSTGGIKGGEALEQNVPPGDGDVNLHVLGQTKGSDARGSFNPATLTVSLLKNANLSTFLHESGHLFTHIQAEIAHGLGARPSAMVGVD